MPIPTQWNNVQPNFSGSGQSMADASQSYARVGDIGNQYLLNLRQAAKDKQEEARYQTEQQYKIGRDVVADKDNADRLKLLQSQDVRAQAAEGRQGTEFDRKLLGEQRLAEYNARLSGGLARGEMTDPQAAKVNAQVEQLAAQGVAPDQMTGKLGKLLEFQAPKTAREKAAYIQQAGFESPDYSAAPLLEMQANKAKPFLEQAAAEDKNTFELMLKNKEINAAAALQKQRMKHDDKVSEMTKPYIMMDPKTGNKTIAYGRTERDSMMGNGYQLGDASDKPKPLAFSSVYGSKLLSDLDIGSSDTEKAKQVGAILQKNYKLTADEAADIVLSGVVNSSTGNWVSGKRVQDTLLQGLAPQRYGKNLEDLTQAEKNTLYKETSNIINPAYNRD